VKYVYLLQSLSHPDQRYIGLTSNVAKRLAAHNAGQSTHTAKYRPWKLSAYLAFSDVKQGRRLRDVFKIRIGQGLCQQKVVVIGAY